MTTEEQIQAVVRRIMKGYAPERLILFGAYAYGAPYAHSNLDLLPIKKKAEEKRVGRSIKAGQLLGGTDFPAMAILVRIPAKMEKAAGIFQSVKTFAETKERLLYAA